MSRELTENTIADLNHECDIVSNPMVTESYFHRPAGWKKTSWHSSSENVLLEVMTNDKRFVICKSGENSILQFLLVKKLQVSRKIFCGTDIFTSTNTFSSSQLLKIKHITTKKKAAPLISLNFNMLNKITSLHVIKKKTDP